MVDRSRGAEPAVLQHGRWASSALVASTAYALLAHALFPPSPALVAHTFDGSAYWKPSEMFRENTRSATLRWASGTHRERMKQADLLDLQRKHAHNLTRDLDAFYYVRSAMQPFPPLREPFATASCLAYVAQGLGLAAIAGVPSSARAAAALSAAARTAAGTASAAAVSATGAALSAAASAVSRAHRAETAGARCRHSGSAASLRVRAGGAARLLPAGPGTALGLLLAMLGAGSAVHHLAGSRYGRWEHEADKVCMLALLAHLATSALHGLSHALSVSRHFPGSAIDQAFGALGLVAAAAMLLLNRLLAETASMAAVPTSAPLGACVLVAALANCGALLLRTRPAPLRARCAYAAELALSLAAIGGCACYVNLGLWVRLKRRASDDPGLSDAARARAQAVSDWAHGGWHHQTALVLGLLGRCALEAAAGPGGPVFGRALVVPRARAPAEGGCAGGGARASQGAPGAARLRGADGVARGAGVNLPGSGRHAQRQTLLLWALGGGAASVLLALTDAPPGAWAGAAALFAAASHLLARAHRREGGLLVQAVQGAAPHTPALPLQPASAGLEGTTPLVPSAKGGTQAEAGQHAAEDGSPGPHEARELSGWRVRPLGGGPHAMDAISATAELAAAEGGDDHEACCSDDGEDDEDDEEDGSDADEPIGGVCSTSACRYNC